MGDPTTYDLAIVGGGINGAGIARDAAGRGLSVLLCERHDLAGATSSASSKLIHGGLRYLEQYEFRLVAEALAERETLLRIAPHIVTPLTFVLPRVQGMRPAWVLRAGLWLYDHLARRSLLPGARSLRLQQCALGESLQAHLLHGYSYADCWVDDARLVVLNCCSAAAHGARILTRTDMLSAKRTGSEWALTLQDTHGRRSCRRARALVNASGPWAAGVLTRILGRAPRHTVRLVKGSQIVTRPLYRGEHAYILQNVDGRVVLVLPFLGRYSLIGTTDVPYAGSPEAVTISPEETAYLCAAVNRYFRTPIDASDVLWGFSGVRSLFDDGQANPAEVTRDYRLLLDDTPGPPLLSIYGGKITTYRRLAEHALEKLGPWFPGMKPAWTAAEPLPGGDLPDGGRLGLEAVLRARYPGICADSLRSLASRHGTRTAAVLGEARCDADLGVRFSHSLSAREVDYFMDHEWAVSAEDVLWRRTKAGLQMDDNGQAALARYMAARIARPA